MSSHEAPRKQPLETKIPKRLDVKNEQQEAWDLLTGAEDIDQFIDALERLYRNNLITKEEFEFFSEDVEAGRITNDYPLDKLSIVTKLKELLAQNSPKEDGVEKGDVKQEQEVGSIESLIENHEPLRNGDTVPSGEHRIVEELNDVKVTVEPGALLTVQNDARRSTIYVRKRSQVRLPDGEHEDVTIDATPPAKQGGPRGIQEKPWALDAFYEFDRIKAPTPQKLYDTIKEIGPIAREYAPTIDTDEGQVTPDDIWQAVKEDLRNEQVRRTPPLGKLRERVLEVIEKNAAKTVADLEIETDDFPAPQKYSKDTREPVSSPLPEGDPLSVKEIHSRIWPKRPEKETEVVQSPERREDSAPQVGDVVRVHTATEDLSDPVFEGRPVVVTDISSDGRYVYVKEEGDFERKMDSRDFRFEPVPGEARRKKEEFPASPPIPEPISEPEPEAEVPVKERDHAKEPEHPQEEVHTKESTAPSTVPPAVPGTGPSAQFELDNAAPSSVPPNEDLPDQTEPPEPAPDTGPDDEPDDPTVPKPPPKPSPSAGGAEAGVEPEAKQKAKQPEPTPTPDPDTGPTPEPSPDAGPDDPNTPPPSKPSPDAGGAENEPDGIEGGKRQLTEEEERRREQSPPSPSMSGEGLVGEQQAARETEPKTQQETSPEISPEIEETFTKLGEQLGLSSEQLESAKRYMGTLAAERPERAAKVAEITQRYNDSVDRVNHAEMETKELLKRHKLLDDANKPLEFFGGMGYLLPVAALFSKKYRAQQEAQSRAREMGVGMEYTSYFRRDMRKLRAEMRLVQHELETRGEWPTQADKLNAERYAIREKFQAMRFEAAKMVAGSGQVYALKRDLIARAHREMATEPAQDEQVENTDPADDRLEQDERGERVRQLLKSKRPEDFTDEERTLLKQHYTDEYLPALKDYVQMTIYRSPIRPLLSRGLDAELDRVTGHKAEKQTETARAYRKAVKEALSEMLSDRTLSREKRAIVQNHIIRIEEQE